MLRRGAAADDVGGGGGGVRAAAGGGGSAVACCAVGAVPGGDCRGLGVRRVNPNPNPTYIYRYIQICIYYTIICSFFLQVTTYVLIPKTLNSGQVPVNFFAWPQQAMHNLNLVFMGDTNIDKDTDLSIKEIDR